MTRQTKQALVTQHFMRMIAGSETLAREVAMELAQRGYEVTIYAHDVGDPMLAVTQQSDIHCTTEASTLERADWDLVWIHHQVVPEFLLTCEPSQRPLVVYNHMSGEHPLELGLHPDIEQVLADEILINSQAGKPKLAAHGIASERISVLGNPAPDSFWDSHEPRSGDLNRIAAISNHLPAEVGEALDLLKEKGIAADHIGVGGDTQLVTAQLLKQYDAVITIGKSVQLAIASGIPVFCYDHYGGPGWLNAQNFEVAWHRNFCGRPFGKLEPGQIVDQIINNHTHAIADLAVIRDRLSHLRWSAQLDAVLDRARAYRNQAEQRMLSPTQVSQLRATHQLQLLTSREVSDLKSWNEYLTMRTSDQEQQLADQQRTLDDLANQVNELEALLKKSKAENSRVRNSRSWRLTSPLRKLQHKLSGISPG